MMYKTLKKGTLLAFNLVKLNLLFDMTNITCEVLQRDDY